MMDFELLRTLVETPGVSGFESRVQTIVADALSECVDEIVRDRLGNLIALRRARTGGRGGGRTPRLMIAAHCDEVGFMVTHVDSDGFVRFAPIGGHDPVSISSQRVMIHGREPVNGVIAPRIRGLHTDAELRQAPGLSEMYIDCGRSPSEIASLVRVGDVVSLVQPFEMLNDHTVTGKAFDDRLGVFCMIEAMRNMKENDADVYAVSTVQEEVGVRGAGAAAFRIRPDFGVAVDGGLAWDVPTTPVPDRRCRLGAGTAVYIMDRLTIGDRALVAYLIQLSETHGVAFQRNVGGGTDASAIQRTAAGAWATTIGAPTRYMHSTVQLADTRDLEATSQLLTRISENAQPLFAQLPAAD